VRSTCFRRLSYNNTNSTRAIVPALLGATLECWTGKSPNLQQESITLTRNSADKLASSEFSTCAAGYFVSLADYRTEVCKAASANPPQSLVNAKLGFLLRPLHFSHRSVLLRFFHIFTNLQLERFLQSVLDNSGSSLVPIHSAFGTQVMAFSNAVIPSGDTT
jgi:hypothetical protein